MPSNLKKLIRARMERTGENWQTAERHVRAQAMLPAMPTDSLVVAELLKELETSTTFGVLVGRMAAVGVGADLAEVRRQAQELADNPRWYAEAGHVEMLISREQHDALIAAGAAEDLHFQMLRSNVPKDFPNLTFSDGCENCHRRIWMGDAEHESRCVCGHRYRVAFDLLEGFQWTKRQGVLCADCGTEMAMTEPSKGHNPWRHLNQWQVQCDGCYSKVVQNVPPVDGTKLIRLQPLVGRAAERPEIELVYFFRGFIDAEHILLSRPGREGQKFTGTLADFREYGAALQALVNPALAVLSPEERHETRERMVADLDWRWDTHGLVEEGNERLVNFIDPKLMAASRPVLAEVARRARRRRR